MWLCALLAPSTQQIMNCIPSCLFSVRTTDFFGCDFKGFLVSESAYSWWLLPIQVSKHYTDLFTVTSQLLIPQHWGETQPGESQTGLYFSGEIFLGRQPRNLWLAAINRLTSGICLSSLSASLHTEAANQYTGAHSLKTGAPVGGGYHRTNQCTSQHSSSSLGMVYIQGIILVFKKKLTENIFSRNIHRQFTG